MKPGTLSGEKYFLGQPLRDDRPSYLIVHVRRRVNSQVMKPQEPADRARGPWCTFGDARSKEIL